MEWTIFTIFVVFILIIWWNFGQLEPKEVEPEIDPGFIDTIRVIPPPPIPNPAPASTSQQEQISIMAQFQIAYDIVRKHEGGYQKMPEDSGNWNSLGQNVGTNWGINAQVYENYLRRPPTESDMRNMPRHIALSIFKALYWDRIQGDNIIDQQVANIFFDGHVNHGRWGIQMMQRALGVGRDGIVGVQTLGALNSANPVTLFNAYKAIRRKAYQDLAIRRPKDKRFLRGWLIRIDSFFYRGAPRADQAYTHTLPTVNVTASRTSGSGQGVGMLAIVAVATAYFLTK